MLALEDLEPALAGAYDNCTPANPCSIPGCPYCDRLRRGYLFSETLRIYRRGPEPRLLVTVYLAAIPKGALPNVSIVKALKAFRKRLEREGVRGVMIGGTEAGWIAKRKSWILHLHILSMGVTRSEWDRVGARMSNSDCAYPIKMRKIKNFSRPLSYMQKWVTYFRPHRRKGGKPSRAVPLKRRLVAELSRWWASHRCQSAGVGRLREYAFFIRRALEAKPFVRIVQSGGRHSWDNYWQDVFILGHELGHALPPDGALYQLLRFVAQNNISMAVGESIELTTVALTAALDGLEDKRTQTDFFDVDLDALAASVLQGGVDVAAVEARLRDYAATERFIEEVSCDAFGFVVIRVAVSARVEAEDAELRAGFVESVLLAAYRTFLNMRFSAYAAEVVKMRAEADAGPINPLLLDALIEFSLRGRLAARSVAGVYAQMGGSTHAADFDRELEASGRVHVERVFKPFNDLLERTVFNHDFLAALDGLLEEDGFSLPTGSSLGVTLRPGLVLPRERLRAAARNGWDRSPNAGTRNSERC